MTEQYTLGYTYRTSTINMVNALGYKYPVERINKIDVTLYRHETTPVITFKDNLSECKAETTVLNFITKLETRYEQMRSGKCGWYDTEHGSA